MKKCVVVLGMHRSGTSAVAGVLSLLGINFGTNLMQPAFDNEKGHFENKNIYMVNEAIFKTIGSSWDDLFSLPENWWKKRSLKAYKNELATIIKDEFCNNDIFAIKDPRISRLFPLWREVLDDLNIEYSFIVPIRDPWEVAKSLQKRNNFSLEKATLLWINYNLDAELYSRKYPRVILSFDDLLTDTRQTIQCIVDSLGINFPLKLSDSLENIHIFLEPNLKHFNSDRKNNEGYDLSYLSKFYQAFSGPAKEKTNGMENIDLLRNEFIKIRDYFYNYDVTNIVEEKNKNIAEVESQLRDKDRQIIKILNSMSWRITAPARFAKRKSLGLIHFIEKIINLLIRVIYHKLPFPLIIKRKIKNLVFISFKHLLKNTQSYQNYLFEKKLEYSTAKSKKIAKRGWIKLNNIIKNIDELKINFIACEKPKVSIIIPVHNKIEYTFNCLKSIYENTNDEAYEVIVVDDCSTDNTPMVLSKIKNIRVLRNDTNQGFLNSCNAAAKSASGEYLVFLNNDTLVTEGWLTWLIKTFVTFPEAGLVGSKLIYPDGRLQEAGGIVWKDGTAHNYGRLDDPRRPEYNYTREVDYCSGACIMIKRELFISVGMFDSRYSPAYYEDTDLAFKVRSGGEKVLYQPNSEVFHFEGITSGTDTSGGIKSYQAINQIKFFDKWKDVLTAHARSGEAIELEKERSIRKRILVIDEGIPLQDQDSGSLRMLNMLQIIRNMGYKISFFPNNRHYPQPYVSNMQGLGIEVLSASHIGTVKKYLKRNGTLFDFVILSRLHVAGIYLDMVKQYCCNAKIIFDTVDLNFLREQRQAKLNNNADLIRAAEKTKNLELSVVASADVTLVVSPEEKKILEKENPGISVKIVANIHHVYGNNTPSNQRNDLLFVGGFRHLPNVDAMTYFVIEIFPFIRKKLAGVKLFIVGNNPPPEIKAFAATDIIVTGFVKDIEPYMNKCRVAIAPLRYGAGVKGKINLSMSYGLPVVATPIGAEGMYLTDGKDVLIAENASDFAHAVINLYTNDELWNKLSSYGLENVRKYFSFVAAEKSLVSILNGDADPIEREHKIIGENS